MYYVFTSLFTVNLLVISVEAVDDRLEMLHIITLTVKYAEWNILVNLARFVFD
jgi:hypothetical protein